MNDQAPKPKEKGRPRDAGYWARYVEKLEVTGVTEGAGVNVEGRRPMSPLQGFGSMWQKTYRIRLSETDATPAEVVEAWRERFPEMTGFGRGFRVPAGGLVPGAVALLGGISGVMVLYSDDESFTYMTPEGHPESGWNTFSAYVDEDGVTVAQVQSLARANDPIYELGFRVVGSTEQERIWTHVLKSLAAHFGVNEPVTLEKTCVDPRVQWSQIRNLWHNAGARSMLYTMAAPTRWARGLMRRRPS